MHIHQKKVLYVSVYVFGYMKVAVLRAHVCSCAFERMQTRMFLIHDTWIWGIQQSVDQYIRGHAFKKVSINTYVVMHSKKCRSIHTWSCIQKSVDQYIQGSIQQKLHEQEADTRSSPFGETLVSVAANKSQMSRSKLYGDWCRHCVAFHWRVALRFIGAWRCACPSGILVDLGVKMCSSVCSHAW
jgi:hypothetical protein